MFDQPTKQTQIPKKKSAETLEAEEERFNEARAFIELAEYIESSVENGTLLFPLPELHSLFENRLGDLGYPKSVNRFRLKNNILDHFQQAKGTKRWKTNRADFRKWVKEHCQRSLTRARLL